MNKKKQQNLEARGWKVGSAADFLGLSAEEQALIELKIALAAAVRAQRRAKKITQGALAKALHSSQSRVAKIEAGDPSVSTDLLFRSLYALKTKPSLIARVVERRRLRVAV